MAMRKCFQKRAACIADKFGTRLAQNFLYWYETKIRTVFQELLDDALVFRGVDSASRIDRAAARLAIFQRVARYGKLLLWKTFQIFLRQPPACFRIVAQRSQP